MVALFDGRRRALPAVEAAHPLPIAPQDMHERAVDRMPEGAAIALPLGIREPAGGIVKPLVHLGVVGSHRTDIGERDHGWLSPRITSVCRKRRRASHLIRINPLR